MQLFPILDVYLQTSSLVWNSFANDTPNFNRCSSSVRQYLFSYVLILILSFIANSFQNNYYVDSVNVNGDRVVSQLSLGCHAAYEIVRRTQSTLVFTQKSFELLTALIEVRKRYKRKRKKRTFFFPSYSSLLIFVF